MEFIDNPDLRQWVKKSLRRALFQKAHELAVQTGCEVLLKVQDISNSASDTQYYATHTLKRSYDNNRLCKRSGETLIAGETGLPVAIKVDRGSQIAENGTDGFDNSPLSKEDDPDDHDYLPDPFAQDSSMTTDVQSTSEHMTSENQQTTGISDEMNTGSQQMDEDDDMLPLADESKIDLTQDSDSDDSIVEVAEVKQESTSSPAFKQESMYGRGESSMYTHPNPYQCGVCQKVFANVQMLEHHNKTDHARTASNGGVSGTNVHQQQQEAMLSFKLEPNSYTCIRCQSTFNNSTRLHNHMTQCHMAAQTSTGNLGVVQPSQSPVQQFTNVRSPQSSPGGIPAAAGSPHSLPQITSVTSLKLMPNAMNVSAASTRPVPTSLFQSPVRAHHPSMSSPGSSPHGGSHHGGSPQGASPRAEVHHRFALVDEEGLKDEIADTDSTNTKKQVKYATKIFMEYLDAVQHTDLQTVTELPNSELDAILANFFVSARQKNGEMYSQKSMAAIRFGLQRHFLNSSKRIDIINHTDFRQCSRRFKSFSRTLKREGKGVVKKESITAEDMERIHDSFDLTTPQGLQDKVFFDVMLNYCNRGRENLREMTLDCFEEHEEGGKRFITRRDILPKKSSQDDTKYFQGGIMMEIPGSPRCPVSSFLLYKEKLHPVCKWFWQRPISTGTYRRETDPWYSDAPLGKNTLGNKVKNICIRARCSRTYTNYCLRAKTYITSLLDITSLDTAVGASRDIKPDVM